MAIKKPLSTPELAFLYTQLARLEKSGIPTQEAVSMLLSIGGETAKRAQQTLNHLKRGKPFSEAGMRAGLFLGLDATLVKVAETGGIYAQVFQQLADDYEAQARHRRQIKSQLYLPALVFLVAVFIQPLPTLVLGKITLINYLWKSIGFLFQIALLIFIFWRLPQWVENGFLKSFKGSWDKLSLKMPYFGHWHQRRQLRNFIRALGLMLQAGLPILEALPKAYETIENSVLRQKLQAISRHLRANHTIAEAFSKVEELEPLANQLISTGDHSGSVAEMMLHYVRLESEIINLHDDNQAAWTPRLIYLVIMIWVAHGILSAGPLMSPMPDDL